MARRYSKSIPNMVNGISQQPPTLRLTSQGEKQLNAVSSLVEGLRKRPPSEHLSKISDSTFTGAWTHTINRDLMERYLVTIVSGDLKVFDLATGNEQTVAFPDGKGYLTGSDFEAVTIADYTILVNKSVTCAMSGVPDATRDPEAIVHVKKSAYGAYFEIELDDVLVASKTSSDTDVTDIQTTKTAADLYIELVTNAPGFTVSRRGNALYIKKNDGSDFTVDVSDSFGGDGLILVKDKVGVFKDLPKEGIHGFTVEVAGTEENSFDNWWVTYDDDAGGSTGHWKETVQPGLDNNFDASTMPMQLVRESNGDFTLSEIEWTPRVAGDEGTAPPSTMIGTNINNVFFYRNRLGFLADENVIMSKTGGFFNFWPETVTTLLDTDRIDVANTHSKVSILKHFAAFDEEAIVWSDQTQFVLTSDGPLTPKTVEVKPTTEFESNPDVAPVLSGQNIFFATKKGGWTGIREYFIDSSIGTKDSAEVTSHTPQYIPAEVRALVGSSSSDVVCVLGGDGNSNKIWVYAYYWAGQDKLQSSWSNWEFDPADDILSISIIEGVMYMVISRSDGTYVEKLNFANAATSEVDLDFLIHLDRKVTLSSGVYDVGTDTTTWTLPYEEAGTMRVILSGDFPGQVGDNLTITRPTNTTIATSGDYSVGNVYVGVEYDFEYEFSEQVIKDDVVGGGSAAVTEGRIQIYKWRLIYANTGYFEARVTPSYRDTYVYPFTGRVLGSGNNIIGQVSLESGKFTFPVQAGAHQVKVGVYSNSHLPCAFQSAEWEGLFKAKTKRV